VKLEPTEKTGLVGASVGMFGQGFRSTSVVKFGGVVATPVILSGSTYLTARVPSGAHTGVVTVTTGATTLTSPQTYKVKPKITSFTPTSGRATTLATIAGSGLVHATAVKFGEVGHAGDSRCASRSRGRSSGDLDRNPGRNCRQPDEVHGALRATHSF